MLSSVKIIFTESPEIDLPSEGVTIFVGPNNSGKSLILKEIEKVFASGNFPHDLCILKDYEIKWPSEDELNDSIKSFSRFQISNSNPDHMIVGRINPNVGFESTILPINSLYMVARAKMDKQWMTHALFRWGVLRLDGRSRFNLTKDQNGGDLLGMPQNILAYLFQNDPVRRKVRSLVKDAFGLNFVIDPTNLGMLRIRLSNDEPLNDEQSLNEQARAYYKDAIHIEDASDGVQAFTGIVISVVAGDYHTILVDEPEAFLHPPLARKLGRNLGSLVSDSGGCLFASTHSSDFLMGCIQATKNVRIVRLEYNQGKSRGRMVDPVQLEDMFKNPLMRSTNAIASLFYDGVVVTESDNDRAFYSEIYSRISLISKDAPSIIFINAQNKQTIKDIIGPLRRFGVPAAAIPDIDIVKDGGGVWNKWLEAAQIPSALHAGYQQQRSVIKECLEKTGKNMKLDGGINILNASDKSAAEELFNILNQYGVFVVRRGELENWLPELEVPGKKTDWTVAMLERLGSDPSIEGYVTPSEGDVWEFMHGVIDWIKNSARKGVN